MDLVIARNPDPDSRLPYLMRLPLAEGLVFRTSDTWPRTKALFCYPVPRRGVAGRARGRRAGAPALLCPTRRRHRPHPRAGGAGEPVPDRLHPGPGGARCGVLAVTADPQAGPAERAYPPTARAAGIADLAIVVDAHEKYRYKFPPGQQVSTSIAALRCGDYGVFHGGSAGRRGGTQVIG